MNSRNLEKVVFVVSLALLAFLYGFATQTFDWPPSGFLERAWLQAGNVEVDQEGTPRFASPIVYDREGARTVGPTEEVEPGLTLVATWWEDFGWTQGLKLIDRTGRIVHRWRIDGDGVFPDPSDEHGRRAPDRTSIHGLHLFPDGDVLVNISYVGTARIDACGQVVWRRASGAHHSIARADDGSFWVTAGTFETHAGSTDRYQGFDPEYRPRIIHMTENGNVVDEIDVLEILYRNDLQRYLAKGSRYPPSDMMEDDPVHMNDVEPLSSTIADEYPLFAAGDLVVSLHHLDLVFVLDPETGRVKWHASDPFIQQHDPDFIGDGWIGVFDNNRDGTDRGSMLGGSRIVLIQPHTDSLKVSFPTPRSDPFYTPTMGKWQRLENGNLLLTEARAGRVVEVAPDGETVWEWVHAPYDESHVPEVSEGIRYNLTSDDVASWPCSNQPSDP